MIVQTRLRTYLLLLMFCNCAGGVVASKGRSCLLAGGVASQRIVEYLYKLLYGDSWMNRRGSYILYSGKLLQY